MANEAQDKTQKERRSMRLERKKVGAGYVFAWNGGGQVPDELLGDWTSEYVAKDAFLAWNANQKDKEPVMLVLPSTSQEPSKKATRKEIQPI